MRRWTPWRRGFPAISAALVFVLALAPAHSQDASSGEPTGAVAALLNLARLTGRDLRGLAVGDIESLCGGASPSLDQVHAAARALGLPLEPATVPLADLHAQHGPVVAQEKDGGYALLFARGAHRVQRCGRSVETVTWESVAERYAGRLLRYPQDRPRPAVLVLPEFHARVEARGLGDSVERVFHIGNGGTAPLAVRIGASSCDCITTLSQEGPLAPGDDLRLHLSVPARHAGDFTKVVHLATSDPYWPQVVLTLDVRVPQTVRASPGQLLLVVGGLMSRTATTLVHGPAGARMADLVTTAPWLVARPVEEKLEAERSEWKIEVEVTGDPPAARNEVEVLAQFLTPGPVVVRIPVKVRHSRRSQAVPATDQGEPGRPTLRLLYTADLHGLFGPCECVPGQLGGLARAATLIDRLRQEAEGTVLFDGGGALDRRPERAPYLVEALALLGYRASGLSRADLADPARAWREALAGRGIALTSLAGFPGVPQRCDLAGEAGTVRLVSLPEAAEHENEAAAAAAIRAQAAPGIAALAVLSRRGLVADVRLARALADMAGPIVLFGVAEPAALSDPLPVGPVLCAPAGDRGMYVTAVDLHRAGTAGWRVGVARRHPVTHATPERADVARVADAWFAAERRSLAEAIASPASEPLPPSACSPCHEPQVAAWGASRHARALRTLVEKDRLVRECLECHSESYRHTGRFASSSTEPPEDGVTCATCHRLEREHAADPEKVRTQPAVTAQDCRGCHSEREQIGFRYEPSLERIRHWEARRR